MLLTDVENLLGITITGTPQEPLYSARLDAAKDFAREYCNFDFKDENGDDLFAPGAKMGVALFVKSMGENEGVQSQSLGDMSKTFFEGGTAKAAKRYLKPYRKMRSIR